MFPLCIFLYSKVIPPSQDNWTTGDRSRSRWCYPSHESISIFRSRCHKYLAEPLSRVITYRGVQGAENWVFYRLWILCLYVVAARLTLLTLGWYNNNCYTPRSYESRGSIGRKSSLAAPKPSPVLPGTGPVCRTGFRLIFLLRFMLLLNKLFRLVAV